MSAVLVSSCLLGLRTRYDGRCKHNPQVLRYLQSQGLIPVPVCPEQLAGLPTPRPATRFACGDGGAVLDGTGRVVNQHGDSMNEPFINGAEETVAIARLTGCTRALLKERSPSCGVGQIDLEGQIVPGSGVTAALLKRRGIAILSEEEL